MRGRKKGTFKTGGREKGTENKITASIKELINEFIQKNVETMQSDFEKLEPKERLFFIEKLLKYAIPTKTEEDYPEFIAQPIFEIKEYKNYDYPVESNLNND